MVTMSDDTVDGDVQPMTVRFPREVHDALRRKAFDERTAMNTLTVEAVRQSLRTAGDADGESK